MDFIDLVYSKPITLKHRTVLFGLSEEVHLSKKVTQNVLTTYIHTQSTTKYLALYCNSAKYFVVHYYGWVSKVCVAHRLVDAFERSVLIVFKLHLNA